MAQCECMRHYLGLIYFFNLFIYSMGEGFFRDRHREDLDLYTIKKKPFRIAGELEAEAILVKYGFMKCSSRKKRGSNNGHVMDNIVNEKLTSQIHLERCSQEKIREAILEYQREYGLKETGMFSDELFAHMSKDRCGNVDLGEELVQNRRIEETDGNESHKNVFNRRPRLRRDLDKVMMDQSNSNDLELNAKLSPDKLASDHSIKRSSAKLTADVDISLDSSQSNDKKPEIRTLTNFADSRPWHKQYVSPLRNSLLLRLLSPRTTGDAAMFRRRKFLNEYFDLIKSEQVSLSALPGRTRHRRSPVFNTKTSPSQMFANGLVKWRVLDSGYSKKISSSDQMDALYLAFRVWSEIIPIVFEEDRDSHISHIDIEVAFGQKVHVGCLHDFDGNGGEVAHSWHGGNMHFDDDERYRMYKTRSLTREGIYLLRVAVHEIGHVLGLPHAKNQASIMFPIYIKTFNENFELGTYDREAVHKIYGPCKGKFDLVMDWVRVLPPRNKLVFNTYFFRKRHYWLYDNRYKRTRYGDPLMVRSEWKGIPEDLDTYVHIWYKDSPTSSVSIPYFMKGDMVYMYNSTSDEVISDWPRPISEVFSGHPNSTHIVPDNIDASFFDYRDENVYFFKDDQVFVYNPKQTSNETFCCERVVKFTDEFPTAPSHKELTSNVDVAYFSLHMRTMFFFKGDEVWQNVLYNARQRKQQNLLHYLGNWFQYWHYICDTVV